MHSLHSRLISYIYLNPKLPPGLDDIQKSDLIWVILHMLIHYASYLIKRLFLRSKKNKILDTLEYLKKGGRISSSAAFLGNVLKIKPVIAIDNGEVAILGKARGSKQGNNFLIEQVNTYGGIDYSMPVLLGYTGCSTELIDKYIKDSSSLWENKIPVPARIKVGATIGTHIGPGGITVAFFSTK